MSYGFNVKERGSYTGERTSESPFIGELFKTAVDNNMGRSGFTMGRHIDIIRLVSQPNDGDTIIVGGTTFTFKTYPATAAQLEIGNLLKEGTMDRGGVFWTNYGHWTCGSNNFTHTPGIGYTDAVEQNWFAFDDQDALLEGSSPSPAVVAAGSYVLGYTVTNCTAGTITPYIGDTAGVTRSADGSYSETIVATNDKPLKFVPSALFDGAISVISCTRAGTDLKAITAQTLVNAINANQSTCLCSALYNALSDTNYIVLVQEAVGTTHPTLTVDGIRITDVLGWTLFLSQAYLDSTTYWKKNYTSDADAKPIVLTERNSGSYQNFLY